MLQATWNIGCFVGAFFTIFLGDRLGRKGTVITGLILETVGKIIQCSSFGIGQYVAGRMVAGIGNGVRKLCSRKKDMILT